MRTYQQIINLLGRQDFLNFTHEREILDKPYIPHPVFLLPVQVPESKLGKAVITNDRLRSLNEDLALCGRCQHVTTDSFRILLCCLATDTSFHITKRNKRILELVNEINIYECFQDQPSEQMLSRIKLFTARQRFILNIIAKQPLEVFLLPEVRFSYIFDLGPTSLVKQFNYPQVFPWQGMVPEVVSEEFIASMSTCRGLFCFSSGQERLATELCLKIGYQIPVKRINYPRGRKIKPWNKYKFQEKDKCIYTNLSDLPVSPFLPIKIYESSYQLKHSLFLTEVQATELKDNLLIKCLWANVPVIINRNETTESILGAEYPLYYQNLSHFLRHELNLTIVLDTHKYLIKMDKSKFSNKNFRRDTGQG